jgi:hypothetical protein
MRHIRVSSELDTTFREELERIVFFNREQRNFAECVVAVVHRYGMPSIVEEVGRLRFHVRAFGPLQTLYALDETAGRVQLVGVIMFTRESRASLVVLHLAVHEDYTVRGRHADAAIVAQLVGAVRGAALRTHGVRRLRFLYPHEFRLELHGRRARASRPAG